MKLDIALEFREVMSILMNTSDVQLNRLAGGKYKSANNLSKYIQTILTNAYSYNFTVQTDEGIVTLPFFEWDSDNSKYILKDNFKAIIDYLLRQYGSSYCIVCPALDDTLLKECATEFMDSLMDKLFTTYDKYSAVIDSYEAERTHLLDGVKFKSKDTGKAYGGSSGSNSSSGYSKFKDTPQGSVSLEDLGDDYNTNVSINEGNGSNSQTFSNDSTMDRETEDQKETPIERLRELEEKYLKVFEAWSKEFLSLFWEEM